MANETVNEITGPRAMGGMDAGVYLAWIRAVNDVMLCSGGGTMEASTLPNLGGLLHALAESVEELMEDDREAMRKAQG